MTGKHIDLRPYVGKDIEITYVRGLGTNCRQWHHRGVLLDTAGRYILLRSYHGNKRLVTIKHPIEGTDTVRVMEKEGCEG